MHVVANCVCVCAMLLPCWSISSSYRYVCVWLLLHIAWGLLSGPTDAVLPGLTDYHVFRILRELRCVALI